MLTNPILDGSKKKLMFNYLCIGVRLLSRGDENQHRNVGGCLDSVTADYEAHHIPPSDITRRSGLCGAIFPKCGLQPRCGILITSQVHQRDSSNDNMLVVMGWSRHAFGIPRLGADKHRKHCHKAGERDLPYCCGGECAGKFGEVDSSLSRPKTANAPASGSVQNTVRKVSFIKHPLGTSLQRQLLTEVKMDIVSSHS
jgi:hypothetical protein